MAPPITTLPLAAPGGSNTRAASAMPSVDCKVMLSIVDLLEVPEQKKKATRGWPWQRGLDALEDAGRPLAHAHAHGDHAVLQILAAQRVHDCRGADSPGGAKGMAQRDGAA